MAAVEAAWLRSPTTYLSMRLYYHTSSGRPMAVVRQFVCIVWRPAFCERRLRAIGNGFPRSQEGRSLSKQRPSTLQFKCSNRNDTDHPFEIPEQSTSIWGPEIETQLHVNVHRKPYRNRSGIPRRVQDKRQ